MGTKRRDAVDPPRPLRDKESNRQGTDPTQSGTRTLTMLRTKQHLFVGLLGLFLGLLLLSTQVCAFDDDENFCCKAFTADCFACDAGKSVRKFCKDLKRRDYDFPGCEKYHRRGSWGNHWGSWGNHRRGSWGKKDRDDRRQQGDRYRYWSG